MPKKNTPDIDTEDVVETGDTEDVVETAFRKKGGKKVDLRELVPYKPPRADKGEDPNLYVSVNGKPFILPRGKVSMIPRYVYNEIKRAEDAEDIMAAHEEELAENAKQASAE